MRVCVCVCVCVCLTHTPTKVTQLVARARKNLDDALPQTVNVTRTEGVRIPAQRGQVVAWTFEVEKDRDINFSAEFFRGKSALSFSVTVAERLRQVRACARCEFVCVLMCTYVVCVCLCMCLCVCVCVVCVGALRCRFTAHTLWRVGAS
jgi:hypothetical protein